MEAIFGGSQTTGRYAMGSNEPLGVPTDIGQEHSNLTNDVKTEAQSGKADDAPAEPCKGTDDGSGSEIEEKKEGRAR